MGNLFSIHQEYWAVLQLFPSGMKKTLQERLKKSGARKITNKCKICKYCGNTSYTTLQMPLSGRGFENCQVPKWLKYVNMLKLDKMVVWNGMGANLGMCTSLKCQSMRKNGSNPPRTFGLARPD
jgi:hypothetical protein